MSHIVDLKLQHRPDFEVIILAGSADRLSSVFGAMQVMLHIWAA